MSVKPERNECGNAPDGVVFLHEKAMENLGFIRAALARSAPFTAVPGWGLIGMGCWALLGGWIASWRLTLEWWVYGWLAVAVAGCLTGLAGMLIKMRGQPRPRRLFALRRFAFSLFPPILAGALLTQVFYDNNLETYLPGMWLMLYGAGVVTAGAFSVPALPLMGLVFIFLGYWAFHPPVAPETALLGTLRMMDVCMALGFGGIHIVFGAIIVRRYGG